MFFNPAVLTASALFLAISTLLLIEGIRKPSRPSASFCGKLHLLSLVGQLALIMLLERETIGMLLLPLLGTAVNLSGLIHSTRTLRPQRDSNKVEEEGSSQNIGGASKCASITHKKEALEETVEIAAIHQLHFSASQPVPGSGHVMIIDDEELMRSSLRDFLQKMGYDVSDFSTPQAALNAFACNPREYDLILLDLVMPGMNGQETLQRLHYTPHCPPIIAISGYSDEGTIQSMLDNGAYAFLEKPFSNAYLSRVIHDVMQEPSIPVLS